MKGDCEAEVTVDTVKEWGKGFESLRENVGGRFFRHDLRGRANGCVHCLLGRIERKNGWQMAEYLGDATPHPFSVFSTVPCGMPTVSATNFFAMLMLIYCVRAKGAF